MKPRKLTKTLKLQLEREKASRELKRKMAKEHQKTAGSYKMSTPIQAELYKSTIPSYDSGACNTTRSSMMQERFKESRKVREAIEFKANCLAPAYSKGAYQYIADEESARCAGRKTV